MPLSLAPLRKKGLVQLLAEGGKGVRAGFSEEGASKVGVEGKEGLEWMEVG